MEDVKFENFSLACLLNFKRVNISWKLLDTRVCTRTTGGRNITRLVETLMGH